MNLVLPRKAQITDVRSGICQLRDKLRPLGQEQHIVSVFGYGYRWDPGPLQDQAVIHCAQSSSERMGSASLQESARAVLPLYRRIS